MSHAIRKRRLHWRTRGQPLVEKRPHLRSRSVQPGFLRRDTDAEAPRRLSARQPLDIAKSVDISICRLEMLDRVLQETSQAFSRERRVGGGGHVNRLAPLRLERRQLHQRL